VSYSIVSLSLPPNKTVEDVWVLDKIIVTRLTANTFAFYEKPLVAGNLQVRMTFNTMKAAINPFILNMDVDVNSANPDKFILFGVTNSTYGP
jgi:hypothetical protein